MPQLNAVERLCLESIHDDYGQFIEAAARRHSHRQEVLAGIIMLESAGGRTLTPPGPAGTGDYGHGRGLCQIDDRSFPAFCAGPDWMDPEKNIEMGAWVLQRKRIYIATQLLGYEIELTPEELERWAIAAYNCGQGNAVKAIRSGKDFDFYTAHRNYSKYVLAYADYYKSLISEEIENASQTSTTVF